jgi:indole-3-glycerol phosphate synthase
MEQEIRDFDEKYGKPLNLGSRIASTSPKMAIAAEFKRASPSKGDINPGLDSVVQCMEYAKVGAAVISVLTEFKWFKGNQLSFIVSVIKTDWACHKNFYSNIRC